MLTDDRPYDAFTPRTMTDEDIADEIARDSGRPVPRPTSPTPTVASVTAAIPAVLRKAVQVVAKSGYVVVEHANTYASAMQRSEELYDAEVALKRAGFTTWRGVFSVEVHAAE
jgi:hypothetical protein